MAKESQVSLASSPSLAEAWLVEVSSILGGPYWETLGREYTSSFTCHSVCYTIALEQEITAMNDKVDIVLSHIDKYDLTSHNIIIKCCYLADVLISL